LTPKNQVRPDLLEGSQRIPEGSRGETRRNSGVCSQYSLFWNGHPKGSQGLHRDTREGREEEGGRSKGARQPGSMSLKQVARRRMGVVVVQ
jgi:hypothetical protein